jgi:ubiquinone/menaquinone biosynthesis C-methylase UbiE
MGKESSMKQAVTHKNVLKIIEELSREKLDNGHITKSDPSYNFWLKQDLYHYTDILKLCEKYTTYGKCLEIGIGYAYLAVLIRRLLNYEVVGIDEPNRLYQTETIWKSLLAKEEIRFEVCDIINEKLSFKDNSFDLVTCCEVIEHITISPQKIFDEIFRVLTDNGTFIITTPNFASLQNRIALLRGKNCLQLFPDEKQIDPAYRHWREYVPKEIIKMLKQSGFAIKLQMSDCWDRNSRRSYYRFIPKVIPSLRSDIMIVAKKKHSSINAPRSSK